MDAGIGHAGSAPVGDPFRVSEHPHGLGSRSPRLQASSGPLLIPARSSFAIQPTTSRLARERALDVEPYEPHELRAAAQSYSTTLAAGCHVPSSLVNHAFRTALSQEASVAAFDPYAGSCLQVLELPLTSGTGASQSLPQQLVLARGGSIGTELHLQLLQHGSGASTAKESLEQSSLVFGSSLRFELGTPLEQIAVLQVEHTPPHEGSTPAPVKSRTVSASIKGTGRRGCIPKNQQSSDKPRRGRPPKTAAQRGSNKGRGHSSISAARSASASAPSALLSMKPSPGSMEFILALRCHSHVTMAVLRVTAPAPILEPPPVIPIVAPIRDSKTQAALDGSKGRNQAPSIVDDDPGAQSDADDRHGSGSGESDTSGSESDSSSSSASSSSSNTSGSNSNLLSTSGSSGSSSSSASISSSSSDSEPSGDEASSSSFHGTNGPLSVPISDASFAATGSQNLFDALPSKPRSYQVSLRVLDMIRFSGANRPTDVHLVPLSTADMQPVDSPSSPSSVSAAIVTESSKLYRWCATNELRSIASVQSSSDAWCTATFELQFIGLLPGLARGSDDSAGSCSRDDTARSRTGAGAAFSASESRPDVLGLLPDTSFGTFRWHSVRHGSVAGNFLVTHAQGVDLVITPAAMDPSHASERHADGSNGPSLDDDGASTSSFAMPKDPRDRVPHQPPSVLPLFRSSSFKPPVVLAEQLSQLSPEALPPFLSQVRAVHFVADELGPFGTRESTHALTPFAHLMLVATHSRVHVLDVRLPGAPLASFEHPFTSYPPRLFGVCALPCSDELPGPAVQVFITSPVNCQTACVELCWDLRACSPHVALQSLTPPPGTPLVVASQLHILLPSAAALPSGDVLCGSVLVPLSLGSSRLPSAGARRQKGNLLGRPAATGLEAASASSWALLQLTSSGLYTAASMSDRAVGSEHESLPCVDSDQLSMGSPRATLRRTLCMTSDSPEPGIDPDVDGSGSAGAVFDVSVTAFAKEFLRSTVHAMVESGSTKGAAEDVSAGLALALGTRLPATEKQAKLKRATKGTVTATGSDSSLVPSSAPDPVDCLLHLAFPLQAEVQLNPSVLASVVRARDTLTAASLVAVASTMPDETAAPVLHACSALLASHGATVAYVPSSHQQLILCSSDALLPDPTGTGALSLHAACTSARSLLGLTSQSSFPVGKLASSAGGKHITRGKQGKGAIPILEASSSLIWDPVTLSKGRTSSSQYSSVAATAADLAASTCDFGRPAMASIRRGEKEALFLAQLLPSPPHGFDGRITDRGDVSLGKKATGDNEPSYDSGSDADAGSDSSSETGSSPSRDYVRNGLEDPWESGAPYPPLDATKNVPLQHDEDMRGGSVSAEEANVEAALLFADIVNASDFRAMGPNRRAFYLNQYMGRINTAVITAAAALPAPFSYDTSTVDASTATTLFQFRPAGAFDSTASHQAARVAHKLHCAVRGHPPAGAANTGSLDDVSVLPYQAYLRGDTLFYDLTSRAVEPTVWHVGPALASATAVLSSGRGAGAEQHIIHAPTRLRVLRHRRPGPLHPSPVDWLPWTPQVDPSSLAHVPSGAETPVLNSVAEAVRRLQTAGGGVSDSASPSATSAALSTALSLLYQRPYTLHELTRAVRLTLSPGTRVTEVSLAEALQAHPVVSVQRLHILTPNPWQRPSVACPPLPSSSESIDRANIEDSGAHPLSLAGPSSSASGASLQQKQALAIPRDVLTRLQHMGLLGRKGTLSSLAAGAGSVTSLNGCPTVTVSPQDGTTLVLHSGFRHLLEGDGLTPVPVGRKNEKAATKKGEASDPTGGACEGDESSAKPPSSSTPARYPEPWHGVLRTMVPASGRVLHVPAVASPPATIAHWFAAPTPRYSYFLMVPGEVAEAFAQACSSPANMSRLIPVGIVGAPQLFDFSARSAIQTHLQPPTQTKDQLRRGLVPLGPPYYCGSEYDAALLASAAFRAAGTYAASRSSAAASSQQHDAPKGDGELAAGSGGETAGISAGQGSSSSAAADQAGSSSHGAPPSSTSGTLLPGLCTCHLPMDQGGREIPCSAPGCLLPHALLLTAQSNARFGVPASYSTAAARGPGAPSAFVRAGHVTQAAKRQRRSATSGAPTADDGTDAPDLSWLYPPLPAGAPKPAIFPGYAGDVYSSVEGAAEGADRAAREQDAPLHEASQAMSDILGLSQPVVLPRVAAHPALGGPRGAAPGGVGGGAAALGPRSSVHPLHGRSLLPTAVADFVAGRTSQTRLEARGGVAGEQAAWRAGLGFRGVPIAGRTAGPQGAAGGSHSHGDGELDGAQDGATGGTSGGGYRPVRSLPVSLVSDGLIERLRAQWHGRACPAAAAAAAAAARHPLDRMGSSVHRDGASTSGPRRGAAAHVSVDADNDECDDGLDGDSSGSQGSARVPLLPQTRSTQPSLARLGRQPQSAAASAASSSSSVPLLFQSQQSTATGRAAGKRVTFRGDAPPDAPLSRMDVDEGGDDEWVGHAQQSQSQSQSQSLSVSSSPSVRLPGASAPRAAAAVLPPVSAHGTSEAPAWRAGASGLPGAPASTWSGAARAGTVSAAGPQARVPVAIGIGSKLTGTAGKPKAKRTAPSSSQGF